MTFDAHTPSALQILKNVSTVGEAWSFSILLRYSREMPALAATFSWVIPLDSRISWSSSPNIIFGN